jgi:hypothetical protein
MDARLRIKAIGPGPAMVFNGGKPSVTLAPLAPLGLGREAQPFSRFDREVFSGLGMAQQDEVFSWSISCKASRTSIVVAG